MIDVASELDRVGDALQQAWRRDHGRRVDARARRRRLLVALSLLAGAVAAGGAIAAALKSTAAEEAGILGGHRLFRGSDPVCEARSASSFHCTLAERPTGMAFFDGDGRRVVDVYLGYTIVTVDAANRVDGACVAVSADGRAWDCYLGDEAVDRGLLHRPLLGTAWPDPPPTG